MVKVKYNVLLLNNYELHFMSGHIIQPHHWLFSHNMSPLNNYFPPFPKHCVNNMHKFMRSSYKQFKLGQGWRRRGFSISEAFHFYEIHQNPFEFSLRWGGWFGLLVIGECLGRSLLGVSSACWQLCGLLFAF